MWEARETPLWTLAGAKRRFHGMTRDRMDTALCRGKPRAPLPVLVASVSSTDIRRGGAANYRLGLPQSVGRWEIRQNGKIERQT